MDDPTLNSVLESATSHFYGKYRGLVVDNNDPTQRGRLQVTVNAVMGEEAVWAMPCLPYAGDGMGTYLIPEVGAGVWVEFEAGDPSYPVWTGCFWGDGQAPKSERNQTASPTLKVIRSKAGLMVTMDDSGQVISVSDEDGSNLLTIEVQRGQITIKGATKVVVEAPQIELVENATHPIVFGDELMNYLTQIVQIYQTHLHPGELAAGFIPVTPAPPVPPMPPPTPALISTRVKAG
ncbi:MAG TPA: phage baseplate assembly protein V [Chthoniobacterales bacterium]